MNDYDGIAAWGEAHLSFLHRFLPYFHGVPVGRWLTLLMNRIDPGLFSACFTAWVRETWPDRPDLVAIDGKTSRRSHDRNAGKAPLHLVPAFATTSRLVLGQEAVEDKSNETTAIPVLLRAPPSGTSSTGFVGNTEKGRYPRGPCATMRRLRASFQPAFTGFRSFRKRSCAAVRSNSGMSPKVVALGSRACRV